MDHSSLLSSEDVPISKPDNALHEFGAGWPGSSVFGVCGYSSGHMFKPSYATRQTNPV